MHAFIRHELTRARKPLLGGEALGHAAIHAVLAYLSRYTHRVAMANSRLVSLDDHAVRFRWKDYRAAEPATEAVKIKTMALSPEEFIRRFLLHIRACRRRSPRQTGQ